VVRARTQLITLKHGAGGKKERGEKEEGKEGKSRNIF